MSDNRYPLEITEWCPVDPDVRLGEVPGGNFMRKWGEYSECLDGAYRIGNRESLGWRDYDHSAARSAVGFSFH